jgi:hypothetical protein
MAALPPKLAHYLVDSVVETLGYVEPGRQFRGIPEPDQGLARLPLVAAIPFHGDRIRGALTMASSSDFLRVTSPVKAPPKGKEDTYQRDWLGEAVNLTLGALKRKVALHQLVFKIDVPYYAHYVYTTAMALERFGEAAYGDEGFVQDFWFECNGAIACAQLGVITDGEF